MLERESKRTMVRIDRGIVFARTMSVIMIVSCHIFQYYGNFLAWYFNVGVEIFLIISGTLYGQKTIEKPVEWVKKQWLKLLVPYWIYAVIAICVYKLQAPEYITAEGILGLFLTVSRFPGLGHLWYINYILFLYLLTPYLQNFYEEYFQKLSDKKMFLGLVIFTVLLGMLQYYGNFKYEVNRIVCYYSAYFVSRRYLKNKENTKSNLQKIAIITIILSVLLTILRIYIQFFGSITIPKWDTVVLYIHSLMGFGLFICFYYIGSKIDIANSTVINFINKYSYEIYLVHHLYILGPENINLMKLVPDMAGTCILLIIVIVVSAVLFSKVVQILKSRKSKGNYLVNGR